MSYGIEFTPRAVNHIKGLRKFEQQIILDGIEQHLQYEPTNESRNKKQLEQNELSNWELRIGKYRVFYDVVIEVDRRSVKIKAVGYKEHNVLYVDNQQVEL